MGVEGENLALQFDIAIMARGLQAEQEARKRAQDRGDPMAALAKLKEQTEANAVEGESIPFGFN